MRMRRSEEEGGRRRWRRRGKEDNRRGGRKEGGEVQERQTATRQPEHALSSSSASCVFSLGVAPMLPTGLCTPCGTSIFAQIRFRGSIVVSISARHAEDPGSIPGRGAFNSMARHLAGHMRIGARARAGVIPCAPARGRSAGPCCGQKGEDPLGSLLWHSQLRARKCDPWGSKHQDPW